MEKPNKYPVSNFILKLLIMFLISILIVAFFTANYPDCEYYNNPILNENGPTPVPTPEYPTYAINILPLDNHITK